MFCFVILIFDPYYNMWTNNFMWRYHGQIQWFFKKDTVEWEILLILSTQLSYLIYILELIIVYLNYFNWSHLDKRNDYLKHTRGLLVKDLVGERCWRRHRLGSQLARLVKYDWPSNTLRCMWRHHITLGGI